MNVLSFVFGILLILSGIGLLYYQVNKGSYKKGERITDSPIKLTYGGIMLVIGGIIIIIDAFK